MEGPEWWQGPTFKAQQEGRVVGVKQVRAGSISRRSSDRIYGPLSRFWLSLGVMRRVTREVLAEEWHNLTRIFK